MILRLVGVRVLRWLTGPMSGQELIWWLAVLLLLAIGFGLAACADGGEAPTGPTVANTVTITCTEDSARGGAGGSSGDTTVNVTISPSCVRDNPTTTTTTTK